MTGSAGDSDLLTLTPLRAHQQSTRIVGLDLLRTVAVLLVVIGHYCNNVSAWYNRTPPHSLFFLGSLGVDLFFALSGFLIGRILIDLASERPGWHALLTFWTRRWLRTIPVYLFWLVVLAIFFPPPQHLGVHLLRFVTLTQNVWHHMLPDYWFWESWSLTIEEWFYFLFGAAVLVGAMKLPTRTAVWLPLTFLLLVPLGLRMLIPGDTFYSSGYSMMVPFRMDEIGYGVILAWFNRRPERLCEHAGALLVGGVCLVTLAYARMSSSGSHLVQALQDDAVVVGCTLCIPAALRLRDAPTWIALLAYHGSRLSYVIYIVHMTLLVAVAQSLVFSHRLTAGEAVVFSLASTVVVAEMISRFVERPFMRIRPAANGRRSALLARPQNQPTDE